MANEKRLIDANLLCDGCSFMTPSGECLMPCCKARTAPTVDAVEVVHGHWGTTTVEAGDPYDGNSTFCFDVFQCSECGECFDVSDAFNYCPNCGAKMDGDGNG